MTLVYFRAGTLLFKENVVGPDEIRLQVAKNRIGSARGAFAWTNRTSLARSTVALMISMDTM